MNLKKPSKKTVKKAIVIALIMAAGGWFVVRPMVFPPAPVIPTVAANAVEPQDVVSTLSTSGTIISGDVRSYFAPMSARISAVGVEAGSTVSVGQLMIAFDQSQISREYERAKLNYDVSWYEYQQTMEDYEEIDDEVSSLNSKVSKARDKLEDAEEEADSARDGVTQAEIRYNQLKHDLEVTKGDAQLVELYEQLQNLQTRIDALEDLITEGKGGELADDGSGLTNTQLHEKLLGEFGSTSQLISAKEKDLGIAEKQEAVNNALAAWQEQKTLYSAASDAEDAARSNLDSARQSRSQQEKNQLDDLKEAQLDTTLSLSKLTLEEMAEQYAKAQQGIVSEIDGVVTKLEAVEGATAGEGMQLVTVASRDKVKVAVTLSRYDLEQVKLGQPAQIQFAGHTYEGRVSKIDETVLDTAVTNSNGTTTTQPTLSAEIEILNPDDNIKLGLQADVTITTADKSQVLAVPVEAVITDLNGDFVWVVENGLAVKKYVTVGASSDMLTEILSGLSQGDMVVPVPADDLVEGAPVQMAGVPVTDGLSQAGTNPPAQGDGSVPQDDSASADGASGGESGASGEDPAAQPDETGESQSQEESASQQAAQEQDGGDGSPVNQ